MHTGPVGEQDPYNIMEQVACTVRMLRQVFNNEIMLMRRRFNDPATFSQIFEMIQDNTEKYVQEGMHNVSYTFSIGRFETSIAGYHCSW